jgi:hypothetical protein
MAIGIRLKISGVDEAMFDELEQHIDPAGNRRMGSSSTPAARSTEAGA